MYFIIRKTQVVAGPFRTTAEVGGIDLQVEDAFACAETGFIQFRYSGVRWVAAVGRVRLGRPTRARMQLRVQNWSASPAPKAADMVNAPPHYIQAGVECIDAIAAATSGKSGIEAVCVANVVKYLWRYELKNGVEDVKKARWYLDRLIGELEK